MIVRDCKILLLKRVDGTVVKSAEAALVVEGDPQPLTARQLMHDYADDVIDADEKYKGKTLKVTGFVHNVNNKLVRLQAGTELPPVECVFGSEHSDRLKALHSDVEEKTRIGKLAVPVTIKGVCAGRTGRLDNCQIEDTLPPGKVPSYLSPGRALKVTARQLVVAYAGNEAQADKEYQERKVEVTGTIKRVKAGGRTDGTCSIQFEADTDQNISLLCFFGNREKERLYALTYLSGPKGELRTGQRISIRGQCSGLSQALRSVRLENCELLEPGGTPEPAK